MSEFDFSKDEDHKRALREYQAQEPELINRVMDGFLNDPVWAELESTRKKIEEHLSKESST